MHQSVHVTQPIKSTALFDLVHSDLWGPAHSPSTTGYTYYIIFVDDFTRFTWIYPLSLKSQITQTVRNFISMVRCQFSASIKTFQSDWGGEFRPLVSHLISLGIHFQHPCPYIHPQNGRVERKHQHIVDTGLTLLAQSTLPFSYWWDAFQAATFLINRLPTPCLNMISPFQALYHTSPDYKLLKVFGCACFPYLKPYNQH